MNLDIDGFVSDCCVVKRFVSETISALFAGYVAWAAVNQQNPVGIKTLSQALMRLEGVSYLASVPSSRQRGFAGIGLKSHLAENEKALSAIRNNAYTRLRIPLSAFFEDCCEFALENAATAATVDDLYRAYSRWCEFQKCDLVNRYMFLQNMLGHSRLEYRSHIPGLRKSGFLGCSVRAVLIENKRSPESVVTADVFATVKKCESCGIPWSDKKCPDCRVKERWAREEQSLDKRRAASRVYSKNKRAEKKAVTR